MSHIIPHALEHALEVPDLDTKIGAVAGFILEVARLHDSSFRAATHPDEAVTNARDRHARTRVMGSPARYIEVLYSGDEGTWESADDVRHRMSVFVYRGQGRDSREQAETAFRALMEARDAERPGILFALRAQRQASVQAGPYAGHVIALSDPADVIASLVETADAQDVRHECAFTITAA